MADKDRRKSDRPHLGIGIAAAMFAAGLAVGSAGVSPTLAQVKDATLEMTDEVRAFCSNIADAARDRRYAVQAGQLEDLKKEIDARMTELETKRSEYEQWLERRNKVIEQAKESLVGIYAEMRPDAAAERMEAMDAALAAAILMKLKERQAGGILNEMAAPAAARLTGVIAAVAKPEDPT
ncbi:MotE family protein [Mesorhizobium xinjiangense]|uniref:MotE family protein n=1 Tax=Mesorhizobium xinjiangense TaxID=2678685 RepID=UPI0012ECD8D5|nr:MotE family protein [Mesorhizobium xinjiangense]